MFFYILQILEMTKFLILKQQTWNFQFLLFSKLSAKRNFTDHEYLYRLYEHVAIERTLAIVETASEQTNEHRRPFNTKTTTKGSLLNFLSRECVCECARLFADLCYCALKLFGR